MKFNELFNITNGIVSPKENIQINGVTMSPGLSFGGGVSFGGFDLNKYIGKDVDVELQNGVYIIKGFYN